MPRFKQFHEFVKDMDKDKAPVKQIADYPGPIKNAPPNGDKPYVAAGGKPPKGKADSKWTDKGSKDLVYNPKTTVPSNKKCCSSHVSSVKEFVEATQKMSPAEFAQYISQNNQNSGAIHESINKTCKLLQTSPHQVEALVAESKRSGIYRQLAEFVLNQSESFKILAEMMADRTTGESTCRSLCRAMNEMVGPPAHQMKRGSLGMGDEGIDKPGDPNGLGNPHSLDHDGMGDEFGDDEDMDDEFSNDEDMDGMDDEFGDDDDMDEFGDDEDMDDMDSPGINDEDLDGMGDPSQGHGPNPQMPSRFNRHRPPQPQPSFDTPKPSMMSRMMAKESKSPALRNFLKALNS